ATMRNKVVHEDSYSLPDRDRFLQCAEAFEKALDGKVKSGFEVPRSFKAPWSFKVPWSILIFLTGVVVWLNVLPLLKRGGQEGFLLLAASSWMIVLPPIRWLKLFVRKYKRGLVAFLLLFGMLWMIVASMVIAGRHP